MQAFLPPQEREGKLPNRTRAGRYVGHDHSGTTCIVLDEKTNRLLRRGRAEVFEWLDVPQQQMSSVPEVSLCDDSFID